MRPMRLPHLKRNNTGPSNPYIAASSAPPVRINPSSSPPSTPTAPTSTPAPAPALPGISTKQRLGALAMEAVPTKVVKKYNQPKTDLRTLQSLKMKKTSNIPQTDNSQKEASGSNIKKVLQPLPAPQLDDFFEDMPYTDEPMSMAPPVDPPPRGTQQLPSRKNSLLQSPKSAQTEVDKFLQSVMPSSMAGPLMPAPERPQEVQPPKSLIAPAAKPQLPTRIPKKYKWNGQFNYESGGTIKSLCNVALSDCTDPPVQGMRFKIALDPMTELELTSFHDAADLGPILQACKPAEQLARLDPQDDVDTEPLKTFARYMGRMQKVGLIPLELDNIVVAHMVLFSPSLKNLLGQFNVPVELSTNATLIAALVPWTLSRVQIEQEWRRPLASLVASKPPKLEYQAFMERTRWDKSTRTKPADQQALRLLKPSKMWHDYMSSSTERPWSTWDGVDRGPNPTTTFPKVEYNLLASLLSHYAKPSDNWRVLFIHIGALSTVHLCRHFVEKRARRSDCALFTYGTHHSFPPEEWGIKEIYNCGGVVTFAPHVLMRDPVGIAELINEVDEHPLWLGYILPSAIGLAARLLYPDEQPQQMLARPEFALRPILNAIEEGKISLISRPPDLVHSSETERAGWISKYFWQQPSDALDMLEVCLSAFTSKYSNAPRNRWVLDFEGEITEDLLAMQLQPALMRQYRRYVVVADDHKVNPMDRVEWSYLSSFTFGDDFSLKFAPPEIA
ncbi:hypothetical protein BDN72DRAFT_15333 [Pluteus cervinus]|uniref:Uncharacterized protein n=1 Tax=Pluteus cervinus TaxID=181527 RepID=A0ACD3BGY4_9AGAR|nr:hypothetical protein BDN72DRAFT_15333 [Pluteus cervinus]